MFLPATEEQLKREIGQSTLEEAHMEELLLKEKQLKKELEELQEIIIERKKAIVDIFVENNIKELPLGDDYLITIANGSVRKRVMGASQIEKKYPHLLIDYPDLVTEYEVKPYMIVSTKK